MSNDYTPETAAPPPTFEQQYLAVMQEIINEAEVDPDRTGTGRARLFRRDLRGDLSDGSIAAVTTRKIKIHHGIEELFWMISGSHNVKNLPDSTKPIWAGWAIEEKHVDAFIAKHLGPDKLRPPEDEDEVKVREIALTDLKKKLMNHVGSIGPMYGHFWRNNPSSEVSMFWPIESLLMEDIPSDKLRRFQEEYDEMIYAAKISMPSNQEEAVALLPAFDIYAKKRYFESNDQLGEVIRGLKRRPFSARHLISSWIPQYVPFEGVLSPHENVLVGRGALTACHAVPIQFFVTRAKDGGPNYLSLCVYQRSCDWALGVCTNLVFYSVMLHLVAHCTDLRVKELVWSGGDCHLYSNHLEMAKEQLTRTPLPAPKIRINPEKKDIFSMSAADIEIIGYEHHPHIKYDVSI